MLAKVAPEPRLLLDLRNATSEGWEVIVLIEECFPPHLEAGLKLKGGEPESTPRSRLDLFVQLAGAILPVARPLLSRITRRSRAQLWRDRIDYFRPDAVLNLADVPLRRWADRALPTDFRQALR